MTNSLLLWVAVVFHLLVGWCFVSGGASECSFQPHTFSFGNNNFGQLGDKTTTNGHSPVAVHTSDALDGKTITAISAGERHSLVLSSTGKVFSFGYNYNGQLGDGTDTQRETPVAVNTSGVLNGKTIIAIAAGGYHSLVLSSTGEVFSFGSNTYGQLGDGTNTDSNTPVAVNTSSVLNGKTITAIATGQYHSLVLSSTGGVFSFGYNEWGQLGDGTNTDSNIPVAVDTSDALDEMIIVAIAGGVGYSLVLSSTGEVFSFGTNGFGELGDGTNTIRYTPVAVDTSGVLSGRNITAIAGSRHSLVLSSTGEVFSFGGNTYGQLGDGTTTDRNAPVEVDISGLDGLKITAIAAGWWHSLVLTSTGEMFSFGRNVFGELGDGTNTTRYTPVAVNASGVLNGKTITAISAGGGYHSLALSAELNNVTVSSSYLYVGQSNVEISWCSTGLVGNITIELIRDGNPGTIDTIVENYSGPSPFIWASVVASDAPRTDYRFLVKSIEYPSVNSTISNTFEIALQAASSSESSISGGVPNASLMAGICGPLFALLACLVGMFLI